MNWTLVAAISLVGCFLISLGAPARHLDLYVATNGSDASPGTKEKPFATVERARDAIRALRAAEQLPAQGITVWIRGGLYHFAASLTLTAQDSGTPTAPIVYRGYPGETVRLVGGKEVTGFKPLDDAVSLKRLDQASRDKILRADLKAQGIADFGAMTVRGFGQPIRPAGLELFFQGKPMQLARWPNEGWATIAGVPAGQQGGKFTYEGGRPSRWAGEDDIWVHGYWTWDWADSYVKVKSIDTQAREISTCEPHGVYGYTKGKRYHALNILQELDSPGEWYVDRKTGMLYFWPPAPLRDGEVFVSLLEEPLVSLRDVSYVTLRGFTFENTRGSAVEVTGGTHVLIADCTFRNIGTVAVSLSGGTKNGVTGCDISETGEGGIILEGGDRKTLTPAGNYALSNHIHHYSRWARTYRPAVRVAGVGNLISHNLIHNAPHSAILLSGNDHVIKFNEIHHVCMETGDAGAFYMGRDLTQQGNLVLYNYFHHLRGVQGQQGWNEVMAIYLDDCTCGTTVFGNVCYQAGRAVLIGGGRDNTVENNIFIDCNPAIHVDARALGWASFWFDGRDSTLMDGLKAMNHTQPPYSVRYPELATILDDEPAVPKGNTIIRNICSGGRWLDLLDGLNERIVTIQDNFTEGDPGFVDPANENFQLKEDSPAYRLGFQRIPLEKIGLYNYARRETLLLGRSD